MLKVSAGKVRAAAVGAKWLLFIHQLPPTPAYLRVKVGRRLQGLGAQPIKNSVYALPNNAGALEDFHWLRREVLDAGGEATVTTADFVEGMSDAQLEQDFRTMSDGEYGEFVSALQRVEEPLDERNANRFRARFRAIMDRDHFAAPRRAEAEQALRQVAESPNPEPTEADGEQPLDRPLGATWVTRANIHEDRMACAWLIRRFIDPTARFKFVPAKSYEPAAGELRFDMFEGEFTHEGERCSFQTLVRKFGIGQPELDAIGEVIRDIDFKVDPFRRGETEGVRALLRGIAAANKTDEQRISASGPIFEGLFSHFGRSG